MEGERPLRKSADAAVGVTCGPYRCAESVCQCPARTGPGHTALRTDARLSASACCLPGRAPSCVCPSPFHLTPTKMAMFLKSGKLSVSMRTRRRRNPPHAVEV